MKMVQFLLQNDLPPLLYYWNNYEQIGIISRCFHYAISVRGHRQLYIKQNRR